MERLVKNIALAIAAVIGLYILWCLIRPWLPVLAIIATVLILLRLWWWYRGRW